MNINHFKSVLIDVAALAKGPHFSDLFKIKAVSNPFQICLREVPQRTNKVCGTAIIARRRGQRHAEHCTARTEPGSTEVKILGIFVITFGQIFASGRLAVHLLQ